MPDTMTLYTPQKQAVGTSTADEILAAIRRIAEERF
jgi:hypothetical protein